MFSRNMNYIWTLEHTVKICMSSLSSDYCFDISGCCFVLLHFVFFCFFLFLFQDMVSLCSLDCPRTSSVDQTSFKLIEIHLPLPPERWN